MSKKPKLQPAILKNMLALRVAHKNLCRQSEDMPHMLLVESPSGGGKTTALEWLAGDITAAFIRAIATDSAAEFLSRGMHACGIPEHAGRGNSVKTLAIANHLRENERTLIVDEADFLFSSGRLIDTLRDIHDISGMPVIIAGHTGIKKKMANRPQVFSRISQWLEFGALDIEDITCIARQHGVRMDSALLNYVLEETRGNLRHVRVALETITNLAEGNNLMTVAMANVGNTKLFLMHQPQHRAQPQLKAV